MGHCSLRCECPPMESNDSQMGRIGGTGGNCKMSSRFDCSTSVHEKGGKDFLPAHEGKRFHNYDESPDDVLRVQAHPK